jgi:hypothetical protein
MLAGSAQRVPLEGLRSTVKSAVEGLSQAPRELAMAHQKSRDVKGFYRNDGRRRDHRQRLAEKTALHPSYVRSKIGLQRLSAEDVPWSDNMIPYRG